MKHNIPWEQLARYFADELSAEDHQKMESWIHANPERRKKVRKLYKIWKESGVPPYQLNVDEAWERLSGNMDQLEKGPQRVGRVTIRNHNTQLAGQSVQKDSGIRKPGTVKRVVAITVAMAATILVALLIAYQYEYNRGSQEITENTAPRQLETQDGEWATYELSDGSSVILHASSRLEIPANFNVNMRELFLEGEAYFEVAHDAENPFIVNSEHAYTRVLGTRFLVQAWSGTDENVEVIVAEGKVVLGDNRHPDSSGGSNEAVITRSQRGVLSGTGAPVVTDVDNLDMYLDWTEGRLVFDNRPLKEIIPRLERWYAVELRLKDESIGEKKITAEIDSSQPMSEVLKGIAMSLNLELEKDNRTVTFRLKE